MKGVLVNKVRKVNVKPVDLQPVVEQLLLPFKGGIPSCEKTDQADLQDLEICSGRRRPRALLNSPLPCVNKAFYHIQELRKVVENWFHQPQIDQNKPLCSKTSRFQSRDSDTDSVTSTELFVEGIAISARESCPSSPLVKKMNDVLGEVVYLIERMEADRQHAEEALQKEKKTKRFLESKLDSLLLWKQQEHSSAVQREHEACMRDITELKCQLKLEREKLDQAQEKLSHTEVLNQRLHEDISFAKKQIPIVKENIEVQGGIIAQINAAKAEVDEINSKTQSELTLVQNELKKIELDTNNEKTLIKRQLEHVQLTMKNQLASRLDELNRLEMLEKGLCAEMENAERMTALTEEKCAAITQRIPEMMEHEKSEKDRILQLKLQIEDEMQQNKKLKENLIALQEDIEKTRLDGKAEVSCIEEQLNSKRNAFEALCKENKEYEQNVEDYKLKISESEKAVKQMREETKLMLQKIIDNDEEWKEAKEEETQVVAQHRDTLTKLEELEELTFMEEQRERTETEKLRNELTSQMTVVELLKDDCANMNKELNQQQNISELTNQKLQEEFEDAFSATKALETKTEKVKKLTEILEKTQCEHRNTLINLEKEKKLRCDHLKAAQDLHAATIKRHDNITGSISDLTKRAKEYRNTSDEMEKRAESMPEILAELQRDLDVAEFKNKSAARLMSTLQSDINNCQQRAQRFKQTHTAHVTARKKEMEDAKEALKLALKENEQLANEYEGLQKTLMEAKQEAVSTLSEKNYAHKSFNYYTQLSLLQKRMHKESVKNFKQRHLYSQAELDRCQALSQETNQKIKTAQEGLLEDIQHISTFLQSLTDDSTTTSDARVNKQVSPDACGSNE
nr:coiled-coil domain-containing protein 178 isoform X2 [Scatophagus argus]XP_046264131.1 coiled-coil domain-containing protein 178 isoform X2 [Scatophagus argus]